MKRSLKNIFTSVCGIILAGSFIITPVSAQTTTTTPEPLSCFDYYKFGSVEVNLTTKNQQVYPGDIMKFTGDVINHNTYPLVDVSVYVKIFRKDTDTSSNNLRLNGHYLVDQFFVSEGISIPSKGSKPVTISWKVPGNLPAGEYQISTYAQVAKMYDMLGLSFTNDIVGNTYSFTVEGSAKPEVFLAKDTVKVNDTPFNFAAFPPIIDTVGTTTVSATLVNSSKEAQNINIAWKVYKWSGLKNEFLLATTEQFVSLKAGEKKNVSIEVTNSKYPVYYIVAEADYKDTKSILDIRFIRSNLSELNLMLPAVTKYPLKAGEPATLFSCLHSVSSQLDKNGRLDVVLTDNATGEKISSVQYSGDVTPDMMVAKQDFTPTRNYANFTITANLYKNNVLQDTAKLIYNCAKIDATLCPAITTSTSNLFTYNNLIIIIGILFIILVLVVLKLSHNKTSSTLMSLFFGLMIIGLFGVHYAEASTAVYWPSGLVPADHMGANYRYGTNNPFISRPSLVMTGQYNIAIYNRTTGLEIASNSTVRVGDLLRFKVLPHQATDVYWNATGGYLASPYSYWVTNGNNPSSVSTLLGNCTASDNIPSLNTSTGNSGVLSNGGGLGGLISTIYYPSKSKGYVSLSVNPPTKDIVVDSSKLSCGSLQGDETSGWYKDCTVTNAGTITTTVNLSSTIGKYYFQQDKVVCSKNGVSFDAAYIDGVYKCSTTPSQEATYTKTKTCYDQGVWYSNVTNNTHVVANPIPSLVTIPSLSGTLSLTAIANPPQPGVAPIGSLDQPDCTAITGWSCDADAYNSNVSVALYVNGPQGSGTLLGSVPANGAGTAAMGASCGGNSNRKFTYNIPISLKDAVAHSIYAYAVDLGGNGSRPDTLLSNAPKTLLCAGATNSAPNAPTVTGPTTGYPNTDYTFTIKGTDPDAGDTIRYNIDWDNDGVSNETIPSTTYVNSGISQPGVNQWSGTGAKTFQARTEDNHGLTSGWTSFTITLGTDPALNRAPVAPTITGPTVGLINTSYTYSIVSVDPDNNTLRYGIDWCTSVNGNCSNTTLDSIVDEWIPASGYNGSGFPISFTNSKILNQWSSTGVKTFKARAEDSLGASSGWTTYTTTLSNPAPGALTGYCKPTEDGQDILQAQVGEKVIWVASDSGGTYSWTYTTVTGGTPVTTNTGAVNTFSVNYATIGIKTMQLSVTKNGVTVVSSCDVSPLPVASYPIFRPN